MKTAAKLTAPQPTESQLQRSIVQAMMILLKPGVLWTHFPAGGYRDRISGARLKGEGLQRGWPDLQLVYDRKIYFLEIKARRGRLSWEQSELHARLRDQGANVAVAYSLAEAIGCLDLWGLTALRRSPRYPQSGQS